MSSAVGNFDRVAPVYDSLARFFFGQSIRSSQVSALHLIPDGSTILILGGGTGWILEEIDRRAANCRIWYIDQSQQMIVLARSRSGLKNIISFIQGSVSSIPQGQKFDVIITNFFLDLLPDKTLHGILSSLLKLLNPGGLWFVTDFVDNKWWHSVYLFIMYRFFRLATGIEANRLPDWKQGIAGLRLIKVERRFFYYGFIESGVYKKTHSF